MAKRSSRYTAFYQFLSPFLETGNNEVIAQGKALWRKQYKSAWRKANRKVNKAFTVSWTKDEFKILTDAAKAHKQKPTRFIKLATLGYINKRYIAPNQNEISKILQLVAMAYNAIESVSEEDEIDTAIIQKMQRELLQLELEIRVALLSPKTLQQIISEELQKKKDTRTLVLQILETIKDDN